MENTTSSRKWQIILAKLLVWGTLFSILYILRSFFLLIFLTFVFGFIQARLVQRLAPLIPSRLLRVWTVGVGMLLVIGLFGSLVIPSFKQQTQTFIERLPQYAKTVDSEIIKLAEQYPLVANMLPEELPSRPGEVAHSPTIKLLQALAGFGGAENHDAAARTTFLTVKNFGQSVAGIISSFFLSLLLSFLIVLDLPKLTKSVEGLQDSKLGFAYRELASTLKDFATVLGSALEAQMGIAFLNATLTAIGLLILGLGQKLIFLSTVVFVCGFIPILGVIISSIPICLVALQESGFGLVALCIGMITIVHMVETYILNPRIYGSRLHINPVLVLIILTIGGKLFEVWGLLLGLPLCTYIFGHAIRNKK